MELRVLSAADVGLALDRDLLVDAVAAALADLSAGRVSLPPRVEVDVPGRGIALLMGAHRHGGPTVTAKVVAVYAGAGSRGKGAPPSHHAAIVVLDATTGAPVALLDGAAITAMRTAAASRLATRLLARADAAVLAVVGTGVQAEEHALALAREREFAEIRIAGRRVAAATALARRLADATGAPFTASRSIAAALAGADVVCAATSATEPVIVRELLAPGAHVNSVGFTRAGREVDAATVGEALVAVESRAAALAPPPVGCNDLAAAGDVVELGELVAGSATGRTDRSRITLFKSVGVGVEDDAAAALALAASERLGLGATVEL